ncbi:MAG: 4-hydroxybenzoate octaprenyltransferase [Elusimicrobiota bacterium]
MTRLNLYNSFIKFEHTLFSLPLLFAGALLAGKTWPSWRVSFLIILAGAGARIVALALNRIIDRHIDKLNPRTQDRHLASGKIKLIEAWFILLVSLVIYLLAAWSLSEFCLKLSWLPVLGFSAYPFFKRFTKWAHLGLGIVWSLVPIGGFFAVHPSFDGMTPILLLALFSVFWLAGFDIIYAIQDEEFDRRVGLHSLPAKWGGKKALRISALFHVLSFFTLVILYAIFFSGPFTVICLGVIGILLYLEQSFSHNVNLSFFHINVILGFVVLVFVFCGIKGF